MTISHDRERSSNVGSLTASKLRRVAAIAALTPEEFVVWSA